MTALATVALVGGAAAATPASRRWTQPRCTRLVGHQLTRRARCSRHRAPRAPEANAPSCGWRAAEAPGRPSSPASREQARNATRRLGRARGGRRGGGRRRAATPALVGCVGAGSGRSRGAQRPLRAVHGAAAGRARRGGGRDPAPGRGRARRRPRPAGGGARPWDGARAGRAAFGRRPGRLPALGPCPHPGRERAERDAARCAGPAAACGGRARAARAAGRRPGARRPLRPAGRRRSVDPARGRDGRGRAHRRHRRPPVIALVRAAARGGGDAPARPAGGGRPGLAALVRRGRSPSSPWPRRSASGWSGAAFPAASPRPRR